MYAHIYYQWKYLSNVYPTHIYIYVIYIKTKLLVLKNNAVKFKQPATLNTAELVDDVA